MNPYELYDARTGDLVWAGFLSYQPSIGSVLQVNPQPDETRPDQKPRVFVIQQQKLLLQEAVSTEIGCMRLVGVEMDLATGKPVESKVVPVSANIRVH